MQLKKDTKDAVNVQFSFNGKVCIVHVVDKD